MFPINFFCSSPAPQVKIPKEFKTVDKKILEESKRAFQQYCRERPCEQFCKKVTDIRCWLVRKFEKNQQSFISLCIGVLCIGVAEMAAECTKNFFSVSVEPENFQDELINSIRDGNFQEKIQELIPKGLNVHEFEIEIDHGKYLLLEYLLEHNHKNEFGFLIQFLEPASAKKILNKMLAFTGKLEQVKFLEQFGANPKEIKLSNQPQEVFTYLYERGAKIPKKFYQLNEKKQIFNKLNLKKDTFAQCKSFIDLKKSLEEKRITLEIQLEYLLEHAVEKEFRDLIKLLEPANAKKILNKMLASTEKLEQVEFLQQFGANPKEIKLSNQPKEVFTYLYERGAKISKEFYQTNGKQQIFDKLNLKKNTFSQCKTVNELEKSLEEKRITLEIQLEYLLEHTVKKEFEDLINLLEPASAKKILNKMLASTEKLEQVTFLEQFGANTKDVELSNQPEEVFTYLYEKGAKISKEFYRINEIKYIINKFKLDKNDFEQCKTVNDLEKALEEKRISLKTLLEQQRIRSPFDYSTEHSIKQILVSIFDDEERVFVTRVHTLEKLQEFEQFFGQTAFFYETMEMYKIGYEEVSSSISCVFVLPENEVKPIKDYEKYIDQESWKLTKHFPAIKFSQERLNNCAQKLYPSLNFWAIRNAAYLTFTLIMSYKLSQATHGIYRAATITCITALATIFKIRNDRRNEEQEKLWDQFYEFFKTKPSETAIIEKLDELIRQGMDPSAKKFRIYSKNSNHSWQENTLPLIYHRATSSVEGFFCGDPYIKTIAVSLPKFFQAHGKLQVLDHLKTKYRMVDY